MIDWRLMGPPVDIGGSFAQGARMGEAIVQKHRTESALKAYLTNPDAPSALSALAQEDPDLAFKYARLGNDRAELGAKQAAAQRRVALGQQFNVDPRAAKQAAIGAGDFDIAKEFDALEKPEQERSAAFFKVATPLAYDLLKIKDPAQRSAAFNAAKPVLLANGADPNMVEQFDVSNDAGLGAVVSMGRTLESKFADDKIVWHQESERPSFATDGRGNPIGNANPYVVQGTAAATPGGPQSAVAATLSSAGIPQHVVAGFLGNFEVEGGYAGAQGDGGTAHGIAQWRGERAENFRRVIGKPPTAAAPDEQAKFVLWEMQNPQAAGMTVDQRDAILAAKTPEEAAELIDRFYERSSGEHRGRRIEAAKRFAAPSANDPATIRAKAQEAIAAGADPAAVRQRAASMGVEI